MVVIIKSGVGWGMVVNITGVHIDLHVLHWTSRYYVDIIVGQGEDSTGKVGIYTNNAFMSTSIQHYSIHMNWQRSFSPMARTLLLRRNFNFANSTAQVTLQKVVNFHCMGENFLHENFCQQRTVAKLANIYSLLAKLSTCLVQASWGVYCSLQVGCQRQWAI